MKPNRKPKKSTAPTKLVLKEIIGLTAKNSNGLASNASSSRFAYVAGCVVVVRDVASGTQSHLIVLHRTPKPLTCVAMSRDGRFIAAGEAGNQPAVLVWDCCTMAYVSELKGHLYGVECIDFSPDGEHLVSVGGYIHLWEWRSGVMVSKVKASSSSSSITSVSFSSDARFIVTAGKKHLKFWTVASSPRTRLSKGMGSVAMHGKPVNIGSERGSSFVSVVSAVRTSGSCMQSHKFGDWLPIYALTEGGVLCLMESGFSVRKSVDLKVEKGFALSASDKLIACACSNGTVQLYSSASLHCAGSLVHSRAKTSHGKTDSCVSLARDSEKGQQMQPLPDAVACHFSTAENLVVIYADRTLCVWDIHDMSEPARRFVLVSHSSCIWDVKNLCCENMHDLSIACTARGCPGGVSFATCSAGGTIRLWDLELEPDVKEGAADRISFNNKPANTEHLVSGGIFERSTLDLGIVSQGYRSMAASSDGKYLAVGDCEGNLHLYDLQTSEYTCLQSAHDAEILSISFSMPSKECFTSKEFTDGNYFLASAGRDRMIHVYDVKRELDIVGSVDDHSAAVTCVKLICNGQKLLSCSADRSLVFRGISATAKGHKIFRHRHQMASNGTVYDMDVDPITDSVVTVGQDKKINIFNIGSGKLTKSFKQDTDLGDPIKVLTDPSCSYLVCSYSNKSMCIYDSVSGEMIVQAMGHGEIITGVIFLPDCKHLISAGADGCIFLWKLPASMSSKIIQKLKDTLIPKELALPVESNKLLLPEEGDQYFVMDPEEVFSLENSDQVVELVPCERRDSKRVSTFRFSISRLPKWAQNQVAKSDLPSSLTQQPIEFEISSTVADNESNHLCPEVPTPSSPDSGQSKSGLHFFPRDFPGTTKRQRRSSQMLEENHRLSMDKRWLHVYTVCLDLINSPEMRHVMSQKKPVPLSNMYNPNALHRTTASNEEENSHSYLSGSQIREAADAKSCQMDSEENALFKQHTCSLSSTCKEIKSKSLKKRRYSSTYFLQKDYMGGSSRLFGMPGKHVETEKNIPSLELPSKDTVMLEVPYSCNQDLAKNGLTIQLKDVNDGEKNQESDLHRKISKCTEELLKLDKTAADFLHSFSELQNLIFVEELSGGPEVKLYEEARELIPSIARKLAATVNSTNAAHDKIV